MKQVFKIFGMHQQNIVNEVSLSSNGLDVTQDFGVVLFEAMNNNELEAVEKLQQMERDDFFSSWLGFEIKRIFVVSESQIDNK